MHRFDRALGILLLLRSGKTVSATELARRFEVSTRTIYRDVETLCAVGVPIYAEKGQAGGFRLVEGYFLPPITFSTGEATSLLTGLSMLRRLRARPFPVDLATASEKLLAALPEQLRAVLEGMERLIGFEATPHDSFHPDPADTVELDEQLLAAESHVITTFLQALFDGHAVALEYKGSRLVATEQVLVPEGLLWDRERWYLVGRRIDRDESPRFWRADRVLGIAHHERAVDPSPAFDITQLLGRRWLDQAMALWAQETPVKIRMTSAQAEKLRRDWYYGHARYEDDGEAGIVITLGEVDPQLVFALLRWLGPGAELLEPEEWRAAFVQNIRAMLALYPDQM
jgi:predicted DNA-binding transcriptional regulator YafY